MRHDPTTENPHAAPRILACGDAAWVDCRCGWTSGLYPSVALASRAWAQHVREDTDHSQGEPCDVCGGTGWQEWDAAEGTPYEGHYRNSSPCPRGCTPEGEKK